jgi:hypothetical protein
LGKKPEEARGKTKETFYNSVQMHVQSRFVFNTAELQKFYVLCGLKKSPRVTVCQFHDRIHILNDAIEWLPMTYFSPQATEQTTKCEKFSDSDIICAPKNTRVSSDTENTKSITTHAMRVTYAGYIAFRCLHTSMPQHTTIVNAACNTP